MARSAHVLRGDDLSIVYHFEGAAPLSLVTSSFDQAKLGLYLPRREMFIFGAVDRNPVTIGHQAVRSLMQRSGHAEPWPVALPDTQPVLDLGFCNNLGHAMWNVFSAARTRRLATRDASTTCATLGRAMPAAC